jgi:hypothetical protein
VEKLFDEYCEKHIKGPDLYCKKVNMNCPPAFCHFTCWGNWRRFRKEDVEELRKKHIKPLTDEQKADKDLVSVIIPCAPQDEEYLERTAKSVRENAVGPIEIITICDGWNGAGRKYGDIVHAVENVSGQRKAMNWAARIANGKILFRLDAHCGLSEGWDARMKSSLRDDNIVTTTFDGLNLETWKGTGGDNGFVRITEKMETYFVRGWKTMAERGIEEETMGLSGTAFMILKDYYWKLGGCDESLGEYGAIGTEWSCKAWLTGGRCIIRTDVVCYHRFRKMTPFDILEGAKKAALDKLYKQWCVGEDERMTRPMGWLVQKFQHILRRRTWSKF